MIIFFFLVFLLGASNYLIAQKITFEGGIALGLHGADITGDKEGLWDYNYKKSGIPGISAGPFVHCILSRHAYAVLELRYMQKGTTFGYINEYFTQSFETIRLNYIEIPILFGSRNTATTETRKIDFAFETGLAFSRMFSSHLNFLELTRRSTTVNLNDFKDFDISWVALVKFPYKIGPRDRLLVGFRVERSLFTIHKDLKLYNFDYGFELNYVL